MTTTAAVDRMRDRLWAVTSYYNPVPYRRRLENYRVFRQQLGLPLLTVELVFGVEPDLGPGDADILVQIRGGDVMWQKERLLNLAIATLPAGCDRVAWIDCDVIFEDRDWIERLDTRLDECLLVQAFSNTRHLGREWRPGMPAERGTDFWRSSVFAAIAGGQSLQESLDQPVGDRRRSLSTGFAWAARRELVERHGLYDAAIVGGGDRLLASAAFAHVDAAMERNRMSERWRRHFLAWAEPWAKAVVGRTGVLDTRIANLWHGDLIHRRTAERHIRLAGFGFDPERDIAIGDTGAWRWASDKPAMHAFLRDYFVDRQEDG
jgi:hypothetical protein